MSCPSVIGLSTLGPPVHSRYSLQVVTSLPCMAEKDHAHLVTVLSQSGHCIVTHLVTVLSHTWSLYCYTPGPSIALHG